MDLFIRYTVLFITLHFLRSESEGCFFSGSKSSPKPLVAQLTSLPVPRKTGYYLEIEEGPNKEIIVIGVKQLPPAESQTWDEEATVTVKEPGIPVIQSQILMAEKPGLDAEIRKHWEGDCNLENWEVCSKLDELRRRDVYNKTKNGVKFPQHYELDCRTLNITCLRSGWTVNRCQLLCMAKCNQKILAHYDQFVAHQGPCDYFD